MPSTAKDQTKAVSKAAQITNNRIIETVFRATEENRDKYELGKVTVVPETPGRYTPSAVSR